jgi:methyl-accepting chemotaxis protein
MPQISDRLGSKRSLYLAGALILGVVVLVTGFAMMGMVRNELESGVRRRLEASARAIAARVAVPLLGLKDDGVMAELEGALVAEDDAYAVVLRQDRSVAAKVAKPAYAEVVSSALAEQAHHPERTLLQIDGVYTYLEVVAAPGIAGARQPGQAEPAPVGFVLRGVSTGPVDEQLRNARVIVLVMALAALVLGAIAYWIAQQLLVRPLTDMNVVAARISEYDLGARAQKRANDEIGRLADALNRIGENLSTTLSRVNGVSEGVALIIQRITKTGAQVAEGTGTVSARVAETGSSMSEMISSLKGIAENVEVLAQSADESSSSILEMAATNTEVAENIQALAASVEETTAAIEQMTFSIKEVANNIEELSATAEETSSAMNEMDVSISQVESNATETAKLSEQAMKDAELSTEALSRTLVGIERIKDSSKEAASVIDSLGRKIGTIGNILNVIDEVAEQTNLLALNAAILAAQSGEHGKGFAVVADEIKDLAERTGASTKEIAELIRSVQDESANAVSAMDRGVKNVEEGVRLGQEAEAALKKIQASSVKSTQMVKAIARATLEQARGSKQVTTAFNRIAETVQQIATATAEQARGSEQIMKSAEKMKIITKHVERSSQEQARGSKQITKAIESISEMVNHLNRAQKDQTKGSELVMGAVEQIKKVAETQTHSVRDLEASITDLAQQADVLRAEVKRFKM